MRCLPALAVLALAACTDPVVRAPVKTTPMPPPVDFADTGQIPCSTGEPTLDRFCAVEITRGAGGSAALEVASMASDVAGVPRVLIYQSRSWSTLTGSAVETERSGERTLLAINDTEFYAIPDVVLTTR